MAHKKEFLPSGRQGQLDMAEQWLRVFPEQVKNENGVMTTKWKLWGIPEAVFTGFMDTVASAREALAAAKDRERHTDVVDQTVKSVFRELVEAMRSLKRRFFHIPPLTEADYVSLGFTVPDGSRTISGDPTAQVVVETFLVGRHQLGIRLRYVSGDPDDPANKTYRIYYRIVEHGKEAPTKPQDLTLSFPEKRKISTRDFEFEDSGKTAYFCVQIENGKRVGPWGPLTSAIIP